MIPGVFAGAMNNSGNWAEFTETGKSAPAVVTGRTLTRAGAGNYANARSGSAITGKRYFSSTVVYSALGGVVGIGIADAAADLSDAATHYVGGIGSGSVWGPERFVYVDGVAGISVTPGNAQEWSVDADTRSVWVRPAGGAYIGGGDPAAGTSPTFVVPGSGALYFAASLSSGTGAEAREVVLQSNPAFITGSPPSGFTPGYPA